MDVLGESRGFGEILPEIAVPSSSFHGACMANERAPAAAGTVRRRGCAAEGVCPFLARRRVVAVEAARVADVACLLFGHGLLVREGQIDLLNDFFCVIEGELVAFRPADRPGVRKGRASIVRAVDVVPGAHRALPEVGAHDAR